MAIYRLHNKLLEPVAVKKIDLERDIQQLSEENLETIFGLSFISGATNQEFSVRVQEQDFYIDTLAFDKSQNSFVIIEYKKDKSISVIDQGFAYLSAMLNHKADFVLEINERLKKNYTKKDINWEQSRVIFVSPEFTNYQRNAINFKDLPIYLYEVQLYADNLIEFDPIKPYRTSESIGSISKDKTIQEVSKEVKVYTEEDLLNKSELVRNLYLEFKEKVLLLDPSLDFHATKAYIGIRRPENWRMIAFMNFQADRLIVDYTRSEPKDFEDSKKRLVYKKNSLQYFHQHISSLTVESSEDIEYAVSLFKQAYKRFVENNAKKN